MTHPHNPAVQAKNAKRRESSIEQFERLRRSYAELDQPFPAERIRKCHTVPNQNSMPSQRTLVDRFNQLVDQVKTGTDVPF